MRPSFFSYHLLNIKLNQFSATWVARSCNYTSTRGQHRNNPIQADRELALQTSRIELRFKIPIGGPKGVLRTLACAVFFLGGEWEFVCLFKSLLLPTLHDSPNMPGAKGRNPGTSVLGAKMLVLEYLLWKSSKVGFSAPHNI